MSRIGVLSPQEAATLVSIIDGGDDATATPLQRVAEQFLQQFKEETGARTRALYALRALLGADYISSAVVAATTPETIATLYLLHSVTTQNVQSSSSSSSSSSAADNAEFARATLYEHLLRLEDLLKDDALLSEMRKYKATAAVGNKGKIAQARDACDKDAHRGHLLQKVFILQCSSLSVTGGSASNGASGVIVDASKNAPQLCKKSGLQTVEALEAIVASWEGKESSSRQSIQDGIAVLRKSYERELQQASSSALGNIGFARHGVEMPDGTRGATNDLLRSSKLGTRHVLSSAAMAQPFAAASTVASFSPAASEVGSSSGSSGGGGSATTAVSAATQTHAAGQGAFAVLVPHAVIRPPPRNRIAHDARLLLPTAGSASMLMLDVSAHPQDWREAKAIIEAASASGAAEISNAQLQKLTSLLGGNGAAAGGSAAGGSSNGGGGGKAANGPSAARKNAPLELFPYLGVTPAVFGSIARSNPKVANVLIQRLDKATAGSYVAQLADFNATDRPDAPSVFLAAARAGFVTSAHLSTYVAKAKTYLQQTYGLPSGAGSGTAEQQQKGVEFLKLWAVTLHQVGEKSAALETADKQTVVALLSQYGEALGEVTKMWTS